MHPRLRFVRLRDVHIFDQLRLEEVLLRHDSSSWCLFNRGPKTPTVITGLSGKLPELLHVNKVKKEQVEVIRRFTGGGTVVVDEDTFFVSFVASGKNMGLEPFPRDIMNWTENIYKGVFKQQEFSLKENDYVFGEHKVGGNAQAIVKDRFVHHTSFLHKFSHDNMKYLQMPKKRPEYRNNRTHSDFLRPMSDSYSTIDGIEKAIIEHLHTKFSIESLDTLALKNEIEGILALNSRQLDDVCRTKYEAL